MAVPSPPYIAALCPGNPEAVSLAIAIWCLLSETSCETLSAPVMAGHHEPVFFLCEHGEVLCFFFLVPQVPSLLAVSYLYPNAFSKSKAHLLVGADSHIHEMHKAWTFKASVSLLGDGQYPYFWQEEGGAQTYLFCFFLCKFFLILTNFYFFCACFPRFFAISFFVSLLRTPGE